MWPERFLEVARAAETRTSDFTGVFYQPPPWFLEPLRARLTPVHHAPPPTMGIVRAASKREFVLARRDEWSIKKQGGIVRALRRAGFYSFLTNDEDILRWLRRCIEFSEALRGPHGWLAVAALVEQTWVTAHEPLPGYGIPPETSQQLPTIDSQPEPLGVRLGIPIPRTRLIVKAQRLGLHTASDLEWLAYARGYRLPGEDQADTTVKEKVGRDEFADLELTLALLSPYLPWNERAICRGALVLSAQLAAITPQAIVYEARRARGELIVRHIAWIAVQLQSPAPRWRDLLALLPNGRRVPALSPGVMPDAAIRYVLRASKR